MDGADWLRTQLTSFGCAACGEPYETGRIRLLAERDGLYFVDLACASCASQAVAIVTVELDEDDIPQADAGDLIHIVADPVGGSSGSPVTADDVLDMHGLLSGFDGGRDRSPRPDGRRPAGVSAMIGPDVVVASRPALSTDATTAEAEPTPSREKRRRERAAAGPRFAHESEAELARILDFYEVRWQYEPRTFPVLWNLDGQVVESFSPDFYLPDVDLWVELTTLRQSLVRKKNRKLRRMRELYPMVRLKLLYARDFRALMLKYGRLELAESFIGIDGQVMPGVDTGRDGASTPDVARSDLAASTLDDHLEP